MASASTTEHVINSKRPKHLSVAQLVVDEVQAPRFARASGWQRAYH
jgi:hypothetical protein